MSEVYHEGTSGRLHTDLTSDTEVDVILENPLLLPPVEVAFLMEMVSLRHYCREPFNPNSRQGVYLLPPIKEVSQGKWIG